MYTEHLLLSGNNCEATTIGRNSLIRLDSRAPQFKKVSLGSEVGSKTDQNKPLRLGLRSFASKLMDLDGLKVSNFQPKI